MIVFEIIQSHNHFINKNNTMFRAKIIGTGVYYPSIIERNEAYEEQIFLRSSGIAHVKAPTKIVSKFEEITEITERKIAKDSVNTSDMGYFASLQAIENAQIDKEDIDCIIVAHNWGDVAKNSNYYDLLPNLAARVKNKLGIKNSDCIAYDILFGCPGWVQGLIQASYYIRSGDAKNVLVVGADTVSRVVEKCDIDSMLFSDGAGAAIISATTEDNGILAHKTVSHCESELDYLKMDRSFDQDIETGELYLKMNGKKVFRYGCEVLPSLISDTLKKANVSLNEVKYIVMHQANGKMIRIIGNKLFEMNGMSDFDPDIMPINVQTMGNNSVATIPTLWYELEQKMINTRGVESNDIVVFASVGAGMHANCIVYKY